MKIFRWRAIVPLVLLLGLLLLGWWLYADTLVRRTVEEFGAEITGARVDLESADLRLAEGKVRLVGLQAANPDSPMRNLFEADEIVLDIRTTPLLRRNLHIEQASVLGVRFGTERTTSGVLENPSPTSGQLVREITNWADNVRIPPLSLEALNTVVNVAAISADSLRTIALARSTVSFADSARGAWEAELAQLDPRPLVDSARALVATLSGLNPLRLGLGGATQTINSARTTLSSLTATRDRLTGLDNSVRSGMAALVQDVGALADARREDYLYARRLLRLPALESPDVSRSIFGEMAVARLKPLLRWLGTAERYLPPGLDPRRHSGPKRARRSGITMTFPDPNGDPSFALDLAELGLEIGGAGVAAGDYAARITGLTTEPILYGKPLVATVARTGAARGPTDVRLGVVLDHTGREIVDSATVLVRGIALPNLSLHAIGAELALGRGTSQLSFQRVGGELSGRWLWRSDDVNWSRLAGTGGATAEGLAQDLRGRATDFLWRTISSLREVEIDLRFSGSVRAPALEIGSNVGGAVARALREQVGAEIERAEQEVRARVDQLVDQQVQQARAKADALQAEVASRVGIQLDEITTVRAELERALQRLIPRP